MDEPTTKTIEVDICGQICPSTLLTSLREVNKYQEQLRNGEIRLLIKTDNHDSTNRVCEAVGNMGYSVDVENRQHHYEILVHQGE